MSQDSKNATCECGGEMKNTPICATIPIAGRRLKVKDIPGSRCVKCGEVYFDGPSLLKLESRLLKEPVLT